jgi:hypothetical protein
MVDRFCSLVTSDTKSLYMADSTRFALSHRPDAMPPNPPETVMAVRAGELMAFSALIIHMAVTTIIGVSGFDPIPFPPIWEDQNIGPKTVPFSPFSCGFMVGRKKTVLFMTIPAPSCFNRFSGTTKVCAGRW